jgi:hypothetical protein
MLHLNCVDLLILVSSGLFFLSRQCPPFCGRSSRPRSGILGGDEQLRGGVYFGEGGPELLLVVWGKGVSEFDLLGPLFGRRPLA